MENLNEAIKLKDYYPEIIEASSNIKNLIDVINANFKRLNLYYCNQEDRCNTIYKSCYSCKHHELAKIKTEHNTNTDLNCTILANNLINSNRIKLNKLIAINDETIKLQQLLSNLEDFEINIDQSIDENYEDEIESAE